MRLELILTELQPFKLSHFRHFCIKGNEICVINYSGNFQRMVFKPSMIIVDIMKV